MTHLLYRFSFYYLGSTAKTRLKNNSSFMPNEEGTDFEQEKATLM